MIEITDEAIAKILEKQKTEKFSGIRLGITGGGCAGFEYKLDYIGNRILDSSWKILDYVNFKIGIDKMSIPYLDGATLDWQQQGINEEFVFRNPNEQNRCGCGVSAYF